MSRTTKDKPHRLRHEPYWQDRYLVPLEDDESFHRYMYAKITKTKKRKEVDTEDHWMTTPSWWTRLMMNRPERRKCKMWEQELSNTSLEFPVEELILEDLPDTGRKPHCYFW